MDDSIIEEKIGLEKELKLLEESLESEVISEEEYKKRKENIGIRLDHIVKIEKEAKEKPRETEEQEKGQHIKTEEQEKPNKYQLILIPLIIILFTMSLSVYLRIQPAFLPVTDDWATDYVHDSVISQIREKINQQYFDLSETEKNNMIEKEFQRALIQQKSRIEKEIELRSNYYKSHLQNDKGQTYLLASDPYFWMRKVENIIDHGHPGDYIKKKGEPHPVFTLPSLETDQQWNDHMLAPHGRELAHDTFHAYFSAYLYKFLHLFNRNLDLMASLLY
ncbi:MAG: STT3 domain-containing protein [Nanoarchaeota archaeon]|nr:STT3 domain-containing protein [Nanoarchaeota archaeon]